MQASKVRVSSETREALSRPMPKKHRQKLKINRVKDYIRSKPAGTGMYLYELTAQAGYDPNNPGQAASGRAWITRVIDKRIIVQSDVPGSKLKKAYSIPGDSKTVVNKSTEKSQEIPVGKEYIYLVNPNTYAPCPVCGLGFSHKHPEGWKVPKDFVSIRSSAPPHEGTAAPAPPSGLLSKSEELNAIFTLEHKAKQFVWQKNSDSLREFIEWLKVNL